MKTKRIYTRSGIIILLGFMLYAFNLKQPVKSVSSEVKLMQGFPEEVAKILTNSCYDCHSTDSQSKSAAFILDFKKWDEYKVTRKAQLLEKIDEVLSEKNMPPKKYLESNKDKALTDDQVKLLTKWAKEESAKLDK
jgi:Haem-binding domain